MASNANVEALHLPGQPLEGCLDAIAESKVYGWTWDRERPADRLTVELSRDGVVLASGLADRPRPDLAASGIGDGAYAFALDLPEGLGDEGLEVTVRSPSGDKVTTLTRRPQPQMADLPDELQRVSAAVHGLSLVQKQAGNTLQALLREIRDRPGVEMLAELAEGQSALQKRFDSVEIFLLRFDTLLRQFDEKINAQQAALPRRRLPHLPTGYVVLAVVATAAATVLML